MINFLPILYPDELLYSVISRYQRMCGMISNRALIIDMFGKLTIMRSTFFPQHIDSFVSNLPPTSKLTTKEIIMNHTMFPFYTAFLSQKKAQSIFDKMTGGYGLSIESIIGLGGSKVEMPSYLRYCNFCYENDIRKLGESYWRRSHQIVGAMYCPNHKVRLKDSSVLSTGSGLEFICADADVCNAEVPPDLLSLISKDINFRYIRDAELLLKGEFPRKDLQFIISFYIDELRDIRLASSRGSLYMNELLTQFLYHYPGEYLEIMQSKIDPLNHTNWLRLFVRNNNKNRSPLRHLLFLQFLGLELDELFDGNEVVIGKVKVANDFLPIFNSDIRKSKWLRLIEDNKGATRVELKELGEGLHTWIFRHEREWYEQVTPRVLVKKTKVDVIDWEKRDLVCLRCAKEAVAQILRRDDKPIRVTLSSIRDAVGARNWFNHKKLIQTQLYMQEAKEDIGEFRIRKIKWAINEMCKVEGSITPYKVQLYAGFGGGGEEKVVRVLIEKVLEELK